MANMKLANLTWSMQYHNSLIAVRKVPLQFAVSFGHMMILKLLIENGVSINFKALDGATDLTYAVNYKQKEMAEFIIESGVNTDSTCNNLKTPLHLALVLNHEEFVILLLQNGESLNAMDQYKRTPIEEGLVRKQCLHTAIDIKNETEVRE